MKVLVTGGAGYIGSHTVVELLNAGYEVIIIDNFSNSNPKVLDNIKKITNKSFKFIEGDLLDKNLLDDIFKNNNIDIVIHFAGYKSVGESVKMPLLYYDNNLISTIYLLEIMEKYKVYNLVFSSSATVYGKPKKLPITEDMDLHTTNPYGTTKLMIEMILKDLSFSNDKWSISILRYFNPIGAHSSGLIGEYPNGIPNNLMPYICKVAIGELSELKVFGDNYNTKDGTGVRDYIHVVDLAQGHVSAIEYALKNKGVEVFNLGTGVGYSVLEIINSFENINNVSIPYKIVERRPGDISECYADTSKAQKMLNWSAKKTINDMCYDAYQFILRNKN